MQKMPSDSVVRAWVRLNRARTSTLSKVESALKQAGLPPLSWYDVLLELDRAGKNGMRPYEIERELLLPQYGLSRLLDRIEAAAYIKRRPHGEDGRGQIIGITRAGMAMRRRMWPVYADAIANAVGGQLTEEEATLLGRLLGKLYGRERRGRQGIDPSSENRKGPPVK